MEQRLVSMTCVDPQALHYALPDGCVPDAVFDFNDVGIGLPVEWSTKDGKVVLSHPPRTTPTALCRLTPATHYQVQPTR